MLPAPAQQLPAPRSAADTAQHQRTSTAEVVTVHDRRPPDREFDQAALSRPEGVLARQASLGYRPAQRGADQRRRGSSSTAVRAEAGAVARRCERADTFTGASPAR